MTAKTMHSRSGVSMVEVIVASCIMVICTALAIRGLGYVLRSSNSARVQSELDQDCQIALETLRADIRLSSMDKIIFYPPGAVKYEALSFPLAMDSDGDGTIEVDADDKLIWDCTKVYHKWPGAPSELRCTTFSPRNNSLTDAQLLAQLTTVVTTGDGSTAAAAGETASTRVIFSNLFEWDVYPMSGQYNGYAATRTREAGASLGYCLMAPGSHTFAFTVVGKDAASSSYRLGIDTLYVSPSYSPREGEAQSVTAISGPASMAEYFAGGSWGGNYHLLFPATAVGQYITLTMNNDRWEDTNFGQSGYASTNAKIVFDTTLSPYDYVVKVPGSTYEWNQEDQTGTIGTVIPTNNAFRGCVVRQLIRGADMPGGDSIKFSAGRCWFYFVADPGTSIQAAYVGEAAATTNITMDVVPGTQRNIIPMGSPQWGSGWRGSFLYGIDHKKSYLVSMLVGNEVAGGNLYNWPETRNPAIQSCGIIPGTNAPTVADAAADAWSARADVVMTNITCGIQYIYGYYPTNACYISGIFDTTITAPVYGTISWNGLTPYGSRLGIKVRTASDANMTDAPGWASVGETVISPSGITALSKRYVQYQAILYPSGDLYYAPTLKDLTITWTGEKRLVDITGDFTKSSDYGIFDLKVDGSALQSGLRVDLEIFEDTLEGTITRRITSDMSGELRPRNTGK